MPNICGSDFSDGLELLDSACKQAGVNFVPLIAETCRWPDPHTFSQLPIWYPESYRGAPSCDAQWQRQYTNTSRSTGKTSGKYEPNILAAKALWQSFGINPGTKPKNWTVCHIWGVDDPQFQTPNSIVRDPRYYSCIGNMVALPTPLKALTDSMVIIKYVLRVCAFNLYGWTCEAEEVQEEVQMIKKGIVPDIYPPQWPAKKGDKAPPGVINFNSRVEQFIRARKEKIKRDLCSADLGKCPLYPKERVREVLAFWKVEL